MEFNILERLILQGLLPQESSYVTFRIIKELRTELSFSEKELKDFEIKQEGERVTWNEAKQKPKVIQIGDKAQSIIIDALKKLNEEGKINDNNISLYERFVLTVNK